MRVDPKWSTPHRSTAVHRGQSVLGVDDAKRASCRLGHPCSAAPALAQPIDRHALVSRHDVKLAKVDPSAPLMVGNGQIGFTADITGLQTFPEVYSKIAPLLTEARWAWHAIPNPNNWSYADVTTPIDVRGTKQPYAYMKDWNEAESRQALAYLRETHTASRLAA